MHSSTSILVALATLPLLPAQDGAKKPVISPAPGSVVLFRNTQTVKQNIQMLGQQSTNETVTDLEFTIDEVKADGTVHATAAWKRVRGSMKGGMQGDMTFDTAEADSDVDPMLAGIVDAFHALTGAKQKIVFDAQGEVKELPGLEKTLETALASVDGMAKMMMQGILSEPSMKQQFAIFASFPGEAPKDGKWTRTRDASARGGLAMAIETTHQFTSQGADGYELKFTGKVVPGKPAEKAKDDGDEDEQMQMMRDMMRRAKVSEGKIEGTQKAGKDGMLRDAGSTMSMTIEMPNPMGGDEPFVVAVETVTKVERLPAGGKAAGDAAPASGDASGKK